MRKITEMTTEELVKERSMHRKTLLPLYIVAMSMTMYAIWGTSFGSTASIVFWVFIAASLPLTLRSSKVHSALK